MRILVGVDGGASSRAALRYAAAEASRSGSELCLVHAVPSVLVPDDVSLYVVPDPVDVDAEIGAALLERATKEATTLLPADRVTSELIHGNVADRILQLARGARLVVLGSEQRTGLKRIFTGSVINRVASHAPVPVVVVPAAWPSGSEDGRLVVAVNDCDDHAGLIVQAMHEAVDRQAELLILQGWEMPVVYDGLGLSRCDVAEWETATRQQLERALDRARSYRTAPTTRDVRIEARCGQPVRVIGDAATGAVLLVIGRHRHGFPTGRLGGTGRALLRGPRCPIKVMPPVLETDATVDRQYLS